MLTSEVNQASCQDDLSDSIVNEAAARKNTEISSMVQIETEFHVYQRFFDCPRKRNARNNQRQ